MVMAIVTASFVHQARFVSELQYLSIFRSRVEYVQKDTLHVEEKACAVLIYSIITAQWGRNGRITCTTGTSTTSYIIKRCTPASHAAV